MSTLVGIVGATGSGKSTSFLPQPDLGITGLDPQKTFIINIAGKPFPAKRWTTYYKPFTGDAGNYLNTNNSSKVCLSMNYVNEKRPEITNIVIDDFSYLMGFEFIDKALVKGFDKFSEIAMHAMEVLTTGRSLRPNIKVFVISHEDVIETSYETIRKIKTVGRMLDEKIDLPGLFTVLLYTKVTWDDNTKKARYEFVTNRDGVFPAKSPYGMFSSLYIPNDLGYVLKCINEYEAPDDADTSPQKRVTNTSKNQ